MEHFAGIDVSLEHSSVCVVDGVGKMLFRPNTAPARLRHPAKTRTAASRGNPSDSPFICEQTAPTRNRIRRPSILVSCNEIPILSPNRRA
jgi:hypothetical protein